MVDLTAFDDRQQGPRCRRPVALPTCVAVLSKAARRRGGRP
jgi:hypothetical protein